MLQIGTMHTALCFLVVSTVGGCAGTSTGDSEATCPVLNPTGCAQQRGTYEISYEERNGGTCGSKPALTTEAPRVRTTSFGPPCSGDVTWSSDFCVASFEVMCPEEETGPGFTNQQISQTTYSEDGMIGNGVYELTIFDAQGKSFCHSVYDKRSSNSSCR